MTTVMVSHRHLAKDASKLNSVLSAFARRFPIHFTMFAPRLVSKKGNQIAQLCNHFLQIRSRVRYGFHYSAKCMRPSCNANIVGHEPLAEVDEVVAIVERTSAGPGNESRGEIGEVQEAHLYTEISA